MTNSNSISFQLYHNSSGMASSKLILTAHFIWEVILRLGRVWKYFLLWFKLLKNSAIQTLKVVTKTISAALDFQAFHCNISSLLLCLKKWLIRNKTFHMWTYIYFEALQKKKYTALLITYFCFTKDFHATAKRVAYTMHWSIWRSESLSSK